MIFEKFVRPAQSPDIQPPRRTASRTLKKDSIITLRIDLAGSSSGGPKTLTGSFSQTVSKYCEAYVNEERTAP